MNPDIDINQFMRNCQEAEQAIAVKHGDFTLFALLEREDLPNNWDVVAAASWFSSRRAAIEAIVTEMRPRLSSDEWLAIARVVILTPTDHFVQTVNRLVATRHKAKEVSLGVLNGVSVHHAIIITSLLAASDVPQELASVA